MALSGQVTRLLDRLAAYPGVQTVWPAIPDEAPVDTALPAFGLNLLPFQFSASTVSVFAYPIQIVYLHAVWPHDWQSGPLPDAVLDMPQALFAWLANDAALVHNAYGIQFGEPAGEVGIVSQWDTSYTGCSLTIILKEKEHTAWA